MQRGSGEKPLLQKGQLGLSNVGEHLHIDQDAHMQKCQLVTVVHIKHTGFSPRLVLRETYTKSQNQQWQLCHPTSSIRLLDVFPALPVTHCAKAR